jgi:hypothetical protein
LNGGKGVGGGRFFGSTVLSLAGRCSFCEGTILSAESYNGCCKHRVLMSPMREKIDTFRPG